MCGIFGGSGKVDGDIIKALAMMNRERGVHSFGVGWAKENTVWQCKDNVDPAVAITKTVRESMNNAIASGSIIGHTRWATHGAKTRKNAHPFFTKTSDYVFAHNGIINNYELFGEYEVDSEALEHGIEKLNFKEYDGSMGVCWIDRKGKLHLYKHNKVLAYAKRDGAFYFTSDIEHLKDLGFQHAKETKENHHMIIFEGKIEKIERLESPESKPIMYGVTTSPKGYKPGQFWNGYEWADYPIAATEKEPTFWKEFHKEESPAKADEMLSKTETEKEDKAIEEAVQYGKLRSKSYWEAYDKLNAKLDRKQAESFEDTPEMFEQSLNRATHCSICGDRLDLCTCVEEIVMAKELEVCEA